VNRSAPHEYFRWQKCHLCSALHTPRVARTNTESRPRVSPGRSVAVSRSRTHPRTGRRRGSRNHTSRRSLGLPSSVESSSSRPTTSNPDEGGVVVHDVSVVPEASSGALDARVPCSEKVRCPDGGAMRCDPVGFYGAWIARFRVARFGDYVVAPGSQEWSGVAGWPPHLSPTEVAVPKYETATVRLATKLITSFQHAVD
jgi:hypothetical protein